MCRACCGERVLKGNLQMRSRSAERSRDARATAAGATCERGYASGKQVYSHAHCIPKAIGLSSSNFGMPAQW